MLKFMTVRKTLLVFLIKMVISFYLICRNPCRIQSIDCYRWFHHVVEVIFSD
ncbi:hypothetical protein ACMATQ_002299 [Klebsiella michiganensis]